MGNQQRQASAPSMADNRSAREAAIVGRARGETSHIADPPKPTPAPFRSTANYSPLGFEQVCRAAVAELVRLANELQRDHKSRAASSLTSAASAALASAPSAAPSTEQDHGPDITELLDLLTIQDMSALNKIEIQMQRARRVENSLPRYKALAGEYVRVASERMRANWMATVATQKQYDI